MKKLVSVFIIISIFLNMNICSLAMEGTDDMRACWISFLDFEQYLSNQDEEAFRSNVVKMYSDITENNLNTAIVHVRAMGDAIYPSEIYPVAEWISSERKLSGYDPLEIMVSQADKAGIRFEAWINPYRLSRDEESTESFKKTDFYKEHKDIIIEYNNPSGISCLALDPASDEAIKIINAGVLELLKNYQIKHIHFDDYFYVDGMMDGLDLKNKKSNVNKLVKTIYNTVHSFGDDYTFGISPAGNTKSARKQGADIDLWMSSEGYIDYIMPQIYWSDCYYTEAGIETMYTNRCNEWMSLNQNKIPIYVGLALYMSGEVSDTDSGWSVYDNNLYMQYQYANSIGYNGFALFRYAWLDIDGAADEIRNLRVLLDSLDELKQTTDFDDAESDLTEKAYADASNDNGFIILNDTNTFVSYTQYDGEGWQIPVNDMQITDEADYVTKIRIMLGDKSGKGIISYRCYGEKSGWSEWKSNGASCETGSGEAISAIQLTLDNGFSSQYYDIWYRTLMSDGAKSNWCVNGMTAGDYCGNRFVTAYQIALIPKNSFIEYNCYMLNLY